MNNCSISIVLTFLFIPISVNIVYAQSDFPNQFMSYKSVDGLAGNTINCIAQDQYGFIWFGTYHGLTRFDGYSFLVIRNDPKDSSSLPSNRIVDIAVDKNGLLWLGTDDTGVIAFDPVSHSVINYRHNPDDPSSLSNNNISRIFIDSSGNIWVCTIGGGINLLNEQGGFEHFSTKSTVKQPLKSDLIMDICEDRNGDLWFATSGEGIYRLDKSDSSFDHFVTPSTMSYTLTGFWKHLYFDGDQTIYIGTDHNGLFDFNIKTSQFGHVHFNNVNNISRSNIIMDITSVGDQLVIATDGGGLLVYNPADLNYFTMEEENNNPKSLSSSAIRSLLHTESGELWVGTFNRGVNLLLSEEAFKFNYLTTQPQTNSINNNSIISVFPTNDQQIWLGTDGGGINVLDKAKGSISHYYTHDPADGHSISGNAVKSIFKDGNGVIWVGTFGGGLNRFDEKSGHFIPFKSPRGQKDIHPNVWTIFEDSRQRLWIGTFGGGLFQISASRDTVLNFEPDYSGKNAISHNMVSSIVEDSRGRIWIGTLYGLNLLDEKSMRFVHFTKENTPSLHENLIRTMFVDSKQRFWVGTEYSGLLLKDSLNQFYAFDSEDGLIDNSVGGIIEDTQGSLWVATLTGISRLDELSQTFHSYNHHQGVSVTGFNWNSCTSDSEGQLYFGGIDGLCWFDPTEFLERESFPELYFTDLKIFDQQAKVGDKINDQVILTKELYALDEITLTYKESMFAIGFTALEYFAPHRIKFAYQLEGFSDRWTEVVSRSATFTNLAGGSYYLKLRSTNSDGKWNDRVISLKIRIIPPFYEEWWFKLILVTLVVLISTYFYKDHLRKVRSSMIHQAALREKEFINQRHEELKSEMASNTMLLAHKNESLIGIKNQLRELKNAGQESNKKIIGKIRSIVDNEINLDHHWDQFEYNFDQVYLTLLKRLKESYPDLTRNNLKLCAYIRLNISSKEIANLLNITPSAVEKARNRLRKKLNLSPAMDLYEFLMNF